MTHLVVKRTVLAAMTLAYVACRADLPATRLTNKEATAALRAEIEMVAEEQGRVALGTCKPALNPRYKDQVACTLLVISQAGTSETQADFHWDGQKWVSTPSESQDILPFPDPLLADIHSWTKNIDQLEPHFLKN
ncbi:hypothetical protein BLA6993_01442 [Burkholderia lata]|uniref:hypothetical protein n=1 Tax=Burkholderia lata (strain ATCC 17760 / DSM 23089 / LMG 22485 / NCIMB 9086 / R18194 / 383) TaxID=482957 RepID=UPI001453D3DC|nr:hypothetical protein [Burkholderia lata]VWB33249.1 hypothetical protein BLA6993_01442 [Burkholderia lata]